MLLEPRLKNKKVITAIFALTLLGGVLFFIRNNISQVPEEASCTTEAKLCADGSSVGRTGPDCEFPECPAEINKTTSNITNNEIEESIADLLASQNILILETQKGSRNFCRVENLDTKLEPFPIYVWAYCGEFIFKDREVKEIKTVSEPIKIYNPAKSSPYDVGQFTFDTPKSGNAYTEDVRRIFPENIHQYILGYDDTKISQRLTEYASAKLRSEFELNVDWDTIKMAIEDCSVKQVFQAHDLSVSVTLTNEQVMNATEPGIDDIIYLAQEVKAKCGEIMMATE